MGWTKVEIKQQHRCDKPKYEEIGLAIGDVIRCDCGQHWKCVGVDHGVQWDPYLRGVYKWEEWVLP